MYSTGPPAGSGAPGERVGTLGERVGGLGGGGGPLRVSRAGRRVFDGTSDSALHPDLGIFLADLIRPYRLALRDDLLGRGSGHSYGEMAEALIDAVLPSDQPIDLIVLAFSMPDVWPERATASYLSHVCPGDPMAFALCDQGAAAAFTGLKLAREYTRTDGCERVLLLIVEQAALHYQSAGPVTVPARYTAVALLCDDAGPGRLETVRQHAGVAPEQVATLLTAELADLSAGRADVTLVIGHDLAGFGADTAIVDQVRVAPAGQPLTGVWWELAGGLPSWTAEGRLVLLAEYDHELRYLCLSSIDIGASVQPGPPGPGQSQLAARQPLTAHRPFAGHEPLPEHEPLPGP